MSGRFEVAITKTPFLPQLLSCDRNSLTSPAILACVDSLRLGTSASNSSKQSTVGALARASSKSFPIICCEPWM